MKSLKRIRLFVISAALSVAAAITMMGPDVLAASPPVFDHCTPVDVVTMVIEKDIKATHGIVFGIKGADAHKYLTLLGLTRQSDEVVVYATDHVVKVGLVKPSHDEICNMRDVTPSAHLHAIREALGEKAPPSPAQAPGPPFHSMSSHEPVPGQVDM